jgi:hypothetical protein
MSELMGAFGLGAILFVAGVAMLLIYLIVKSRPLSYEGGTPGVGSSGGRPP